jgi:hypothetical protein
MQTAFGLLEAAAMGPPQIIDDPYQQRNPDFGYSLDAICDVDGDSISDIVVGARL